jgi:hypothetical protein
MTESVKKNPDGVIDISIYLIKEMTLKKYSYSIQYESDYLKFSKLCQRRKYGAALNFIKKIDIAVKEVEDDHGMVHSPRN